MKSNSSNKHLERFVNILVRLHAANVKTTKNLSDYENEALCLELCSALEGFINYVALASRTHCKSDGKKGMGNAEKVKILLASGVSLEDIRIDALARIVSKIDRVLAKPLEAQVAYCYKIVNNCVKDELDRLPPKDIHMDSIDREIKGHGFAEGERATLGTLSRIPIPRRSGSPSRRKRFSMSSPGSASRNRPLSACAART